MNNWVNELRAYDDKIADRERRKKVWLDKLINQEVKPNFINDKREYYRKEYLQSDHWKNLRLHKIMANPCCQRCSSTVSLDVHHLNYRNLYDVQLDDLETLCRGCHLLEHDREEKKKVSKYVKVDSPKEVNTNELPLDRKDLKVNENFMPQSYDERRSSSFLRKERKRIRRMRKQAEIIASQKKKKQ